MAIRLRSVEGHLVALCAAETDPELNDLYLDDGAHYALAAKFARDWRGQTVDWTHPEDDRVAETQRLRDAKEELDRWLASEAKASTPPPSIGRDQG